ncbi:MAG: hypothetical protein WC501_04225 [Candidatus Micrarchaeia archaeon]
MLSSQYENVSKKIIKRVVPIVCACALAVVFSRSPLIENILRTDRPTQTTATQSDNYNYFQQAAKGNKNLVHLLKNGKHDLAVYLSERLKELKHATPEGYLLLHPAREITVMETPSAEQLQQFETIQLIKIYYIMQALSDPEFRNRIFEELEKDTTDRKSEHGGALHLLHSCEKSTATIEMVPSQYRGNVIEDFTGRQFNPDSIYSPKQIPDTPDMLGPFHFHARAISPHYTAFSGNDFFSMANVFGFTEFFLFSRPERNQFNADMAIILVEKDGRTIKAKIDLDLGTYER